MERLELWRPRVQRRYWMPASETLALQVHWQERSWLCAGDHCPLCDFLPARSVIYFAAWARTGTDTPKLVLLERSPTVMAEALRLAGLLQEESVGLMIVQERTSGRIIEVEQAVLSRLPRDQRVPIDQLSLSVARLYRLANVPLATSVAEAQRVLSARSRAQIDGFLAMNRQGSLN